MIYSFTTPRAFLFMLAVFTSAYAPLLLHNFMCWDDLGIAMWDRHLSDDPYALFNLQQGRFGAFLLNPLQHRWLYLDTSASLRCIGVLLLSILCALQYSIMRQLDYSPIPTLVVSTMSGMLPTFYACIMVVNDQHMLVADILAGLAAYLLINKQGRPWQRVSGFVLIVMAQATYTTGSAYFLAFIAIYLFAPSTKIDKASVMRCLTLIAIWCTACLLWYVGTLALLRGLNIGRSSIEGRDLHFNPDVLGQLWFYLRDVLPQSLNLCLWFYDTSSSEYKWHTISVGLFVLFLWGIHSLLCKKAATGKMYASAFGLAFVLMALTVSPLLAPIPGRVVPGYAMTPHLLLLIFFAYFGIEAICDTIPMLGRNLLRASILLSMMAMTDWILQEYEVNPALAEQAYVRGVIRSIKNNGSVTVAVIPDTNRPTLVNTPMGNIWGMRAWPIHLTYEVLREDKNLGISQFTESDDKHATWPAGKVIILSAGSAIPPNAYVVDMRLVPQL